VDFFAVKAKFFPGKGSRKSSASLARDAPTFSESRSVSLVGFRKQRALNVKDG
jgi:hypothetical protein